MLWGTREAGMEQRFRFCLRQGPQSLTTAVSPLPRVCQQLPPVLSGEALAATLSGLLCPKVVFWPVYPILSFLSYAYFLHLDFCGLNFIFGSSVKFTSQEENISFLICPSFSLNLGEVCP